MGNRPLMTIVVINIPGIPCTIVNRSSLHDARTHTTHTHTRTPRIGRGTNNGSSGAGPPPAGGRHVAVAEYLCE